jgi:hypothetical protein
MMVAGKKSVSPEEVFVFQTVDRYPLKKTSWTSVLLTLSSIINRTANIRCRLPNFRFPQVIEGVQDLPQIFEENLNLKYRKI